MLLAEYYRLKKTEDNPEAGRIYQDARRLDVRRVHRKKVDRAYHEPEEVDCIYTGGLREEVDEIVGIGDIFVRDDGTALLKTPQKWRKLLNSL